MRGIGKLEKNTAIQQGVVGPVARASGLDMDVRKTGFYAYKDLGFKPIIGRESDCFARMELRLQEILQSIQLVEACAERMPAGEFKTKGRLMKIEAGESTGRVEAPRGELLYYVISNGDLNPLRARIRTPSYANFNAIREMLVGHTIADAPVIIQSIDPCMSCTDRVLVVDKDSGKKTVVNLEGRVKKCQRA